MVRRFEINITCASCVKKIDKIFSKFDDFNYSINLIEKLLIINANEEKYTSEFILKELKKIGYEGEEI